MAKIGEKHGISYNKHGKKVNAWAGISKGDKKNKYSAFYRECD